MVVIYDLVLVFSVLTHRHNKIIFNVPSCGNNFSQIMFFVKSGISPPKQNYVTIDLLIVYFAGNQGSDFQRVRESKTTFMASTVQVFLQYK